jgi:hypothetical protein
MGLLWDDDVWGKTVSLNTGVVFLTSFNTNFLGM